MIKKIIPLIVIGFLFSLNMPLISGQNDFEICINNNGSDNEKSSIQNEVLISIYGSFYMMKNKPYNETLGLYVTFENTRSDSINSYLGFQLKTISTLPWDYIYKTDDNYTLPPNSFNGFILSIDFGIGIFFFTFFIEGTGKDIDQYFEQKAIGICWNYYVFVLKVV